jgi:hypothetical protein
MSASLHEPIQHGRSRLSDHHVHIGGRDQDVSPGTLSEYLPLLA